jgi:urease accessory protein
VTPDILIALQHADSAFPSGSFGFSNGIEGLFGLGLPKGRESLEQVLIATLRHRWASADRVALVRAFRAGDDLDAICAIDHGVETTILPEPLRVGSRRNGGALLAAHARLETLGAAALRAEIDAGRAYGHLPVVQGTMWRARGMSEQTAVAVSGYATAAGLTTAAIRLGRIGAIDAQGVLAAALAVVAEAAAEAVPSDAEIESFTPWLDIAAARHARAPLRLFAN